MAHTEIIGNSGPGSHSNRIADLTADPPGMQLGTGHPDGQ
jgi:hypothetical protein